MRSRRVDSYSDCNIKAPIFPIFVMSTAEILRLPKMISFEEAVKRNLIREYKEDLGKMFFWSHQWLSAAHPDPDTIQFATLQKTIRHLSTADGIKTAFATINASSHTRAFSMLNISEQTMTEAVETGWHWLDYYSIPQSASHQGQMNREAAIASIPAYAQAAWLFLALTPHAIHQEPARTVKSNKCNFETWCNRGWCRLERISCMWVRSQPNALLVADPDNLEVMPPTNQIVAEDSVCNGMFSCCGYDHTRLLAGKRRCGGCMRPHYHAVETRCDKIALLPVMRDIYAEHLRRVLKECGHGVRFRLALALRAPFFAGSDELKDESAVFTYENFIEDFEFEGPRDHDEFRNTPLHWATFIGSERATKGLIAGGADVDARSKAEKGTYEDSVREFYFIAGGGATPIHTGIMRQSMGCVGLLVDHKADINAVTVDGRSALWMAASRKMHDPMRFLISRDADVNVKTNEKGDFLNCADGTSALLISCFVGDTQGARMLIEANADVNVQNFQGATPLLNSLIRSPQPVALELIELLVENKADLNARFRTGLPAHAAIYSGLDCVDLAKWRKGALDECVKRLDVLRGAT